MRVYTLVTIPWLLLMAVLTVSGCSTLSHRTYQDKFPEPCTTDWFIAIEQELKLTDATTQQPVPGSEPWLQAADDKLALAAKTGHQIGDLEWCHQLHQRLIGL